MKTPLVVILPNFQYRRYVGRTLTHKATASRDLEATEVEAFRVVPDKCMKPDDNGGEAA